jgi:hypothetical protein
LFFSDGSAARKRLYCRSVCAIAENVRLVTKYDGRAVEIRRGQQRTFRGDKQPRPRSARAGITPYIRCCSSRSRNMVSNFN